MQKTIEQFSDLELKSMKSDIYESNMQNAQNLQVINTELQKRANQAKVNNEKTTEEVAEKTDDHKEEPKSE
jgi:hypothetical protein